ncbi:hypothetical protein GUITHDRAFT_143245 [Guillardia theta CCMP2712]|uniref:C2H2-type domain-containing protein n=1 Tax=Guillardia theta (strain CCMP2712) TaxID=905079 RepID=L1IUE8_GUITC|nr:hypothetical protein GUITHDRAFT_143245 [Guillardia theta CCMP2712]EKX39871.1 hypothetical protein GUITHDRAFT_143245 [Guillardia theta CCMP2712]|eukprot:XP_005826851.1 hypothetical protein GUITHDRAFT_143245 [Guillardia theta CCMP2712]
MPPSPPFLTRALVRSSLPIASLSRHVHRSRVTFTHLDGTPGPLHQAPRHVLSSLWHVQGVLGCGGRRAPGDRWATTGAEEGEEDVVQSLQSAGEANTKRVKEGEGWSKVFECPTCGERFSKWKKLQFHLKTRQHIKRGSYPTWKLVVVMFRNEARAQPEVRGRPGPLTYYLCPLCAYSSRSWARMWEHVGRTGHISRHSYRTQKELQILLRQGPAVLLRPAGTVPFTITSEALAVMWECCKGTAHQDLCDTGCLKGRGRWLEIDMELHQRRLFAEDEYVMLAWVKQVKSGAKQGYFIVKRNRARVPGRGASPGYGCPHCGRAFDKFTRFLKHFKEEGCMSAMGRSSFMTLEEVQYRAMLVSPLSKRALVRQNSIDVAGWNPAWLEDLRPRVQKEQEKHEFVEDQPGFQFVV